MADFHQAFLIDGIMHGVIVRCSTNCRRRRCERGAEAGACALVERVALFLPEGEGERNEPDARMA